MDPPGAVDAAAMPHLLFLSTLLQFLKWPVALAALVFLPSALWALGYQVAMDLGALAIVLTGVALYALIWWWLIRHWTVSWLSTLEHEITHGIFALLTGHRVKGLKVTLRDGGHILLLGPGNWLIDVAPYFFPTATVILILALPWIPFFDGAPGQLLLGLSLGYHLTSTWTETHHAQTDLQKAGFLFCWLFLPAANVAGLGLMLAAAQSGWGGMFDWLGVAWSSPWRPEVIWQWGMARF